MLGVLTLKVMFGFVFFFDLKTNTNHQNVFSRITLLDHYVKQIFRMQYEERTEENKTRSREMK